MSYLDPLKSFSIRTLSGTRDLVLPIIERPIDNHSLVGKGEFYAADLFPWVKKLEANWRTIREELDALLAGDLYIPNFQEVLPSQERLTQDNQWKTFVFYGYGYKAEMNCAICPRTTALIEAVPGMKTAFFSILSPGKHIPPHRGFYKGVLRYHLGLIVPEPNEKVRIRVGNEIRHWEEGKSLIFDDTYEHEVWNDTDGRRVVLFMDVVRPLSGHWATWNEAVIKFISLLPEIQNARRREKKWIEKN